MFKRTTREKYFYSLEVLPPAYQDGKGFLVEGFLVGEPMDHRTCTVSGLIAPTYAAFMERKGRFYESISAVTIAEYKKHK